MSVQQQLEQQQQQVEEEGPCHSERINCSLFLSRLLFSKAWASVARFFTNVHAQQDEHASQKGYSESRPEPSLEGIAASTATSDTALHQL